MSTPTSAETTILLSEVGRDVSALAAVANMSASEVQRLPDVGEALARVHAAVERLRSMPEQVYSLLYQQIKAQRPPGLRLRPGTVGSYLWGCEASRAKGGCAPLCAGSIPTPSGVATPCTQPVLVGWPSGNGFQFVAVVSQPTDAPQNTAILYLPVESRSRLWFPAADVARLQNYGLKSVDIRFYDGGDVKGGLGVLSLEQLPRTPPAPGVNWKKYWWVLVLLLVLVLLAVLVARKRR